MDSLDASIRRLEDYVKAKIGKTQQNIKCGLSGERDDRTNHIISKSRKLKQKRIRVDTTEWGR